MAHWLLFYDLCDNYLERRPEHKPEHLAYALEAVDRGELILGGALADPADQGVLLFEGDGPEVAEQFARNDPFTREGLVTAWRVRPWVTTLGAQAVDPQRL